MNEEIKKDKSTIPSQSTPSNKPSTPTIKPNITADRTEALQDSIDINLNHEKSFKPTTSMSTVSSEPSLKTPKKEN